MSAGDGPPRRTVRVRSVHGEVEAFADDLITRQIRKFGAHTRPEFAFALAALGHRMNVFDIGAHIGTFSVAALGKLAPRQRLLAVEGSAETFAVLQSNLAGRGAAQVATERAFVGSRSDMAYVAPARPSFEPTPAPADRAILEGQLNALVTRDLAVGEMWITEDQLDANPGLVKTGIRANYLGAGSLRHLAPQEAGRGGGEAMIGLDDLAERHFVPDYVKIDIEGAEFDALAGSKMIAEHRPILYLEVGRAALAGYGHAPEDLDALLRRLGYDFYVNGFDRNAAHDFYRVERIASLVRPAALFDVLCVPSDSRIGRALERLTSTATPRKQHRVVAAAMRNPAVAKVRRALARLAPAAARKG